MTSPRNGKRLDYTQAARLYQSGMSLPKIAAALGSTSPTVLRALRAQGIPTRTIAEGVSLASRGNRRIDGGYVTVCHARNVRKREHIIIAEKALGRALRRNECVHHVNCDPLDNRPENLLICTRAYHTALHWRMRKQEGATP